MLLSSMKATGGLCTRGVGGQIRDTPPEGYGVGEEYNSSTMVALEVVLDVDRSRYCNFDGLDEVYYFAGEVMRRPSSVSTPATITIDSSCLGSHLSQREALSTC